MRLHGDLRSWFHYSLSGFLSDTIFQDHLKTTKRHRYPPEVVCKAILLQARPSLQVPHGGQLRSGHLDWLREQCPCDVGKGCKMFFLDNLSSLLQLLEKNYFFFLGKSILRGVVVKNAFLECSLFFTTFGELKKKLSSN